VLEHLDQLIIVLGLLEEDFDFARELVLDLCDLTFKDLVARDNSLVLCLELLELFHLFSEVKLGLFELLRPVVVHLGKVPLSVRDFPCEDTRSLRDDRKIIPHHGVSELRHRRVLHVHLLELRLVNL